MEYQTLLESVQTHAALATPGRRAPPWRAPSPRWPTCSTTPSGLAAAQESQAGRLDLAGFLQEVADRAECAEEQAGYRAQATLSAFADADPELGSALLDALPDEFDALTAPLRTGGGLVAPTDGPAPLEQPEIEHLLRTRAAPLDRRHHRAVPHRLAAAREPRRPRPANRGLDPRMRGGPELVVSADSARST